EVTGRGDGEKLGQTLHRAEDYGFEDVRHSVNLAGRRRRNKWAHQDVIPQRRVVGLQKAGVESCSGMGASPTPEVVGYAAVLQTHPEGVVSKRAAHRRRWALTPAVEKAGSVGAQPMPRGIGGCPPSPS